MSLLPTFHVPTEDEIRAFYLSRAWRQLSYRMKIRHGRRCQCCGASAADGAKIVSDHVKPLRLHWDIRLDETNIQVLCEDCNLGKGSWDETDHRPPQVVDEFALLERLDRCGCSLVEQPTAFKQIIMAAFSGDEIRQEEAISLIQRYNLVSA